MPEYTCPVQWTGRQAVVTLPARVDGSNADQIREQLLWIINRGAAELIVDLTETLCCDYSGADALARAQRHAVANGTELRLVVFADVVCRVLPLSGLDRLVAVYPDLESAIAAAERREALGEQGTGTADQAARAGELLDSVAHNILTTGLMVQTVTGLPRAAAQRITEALGRLDLVAQEVRDDVLAERGRGTGPDRAWRPPPDVLERSALARNRSAVLRERVAQTANALYFAAADTAALLERQAGLLGQPSRLDHPTEIKRWRVFADQARQMAERWKQHP